MYKTINNLTMAYSDVQKILYQEQDSLNNIPENLESSGLYSKIESSIDDLEDALDSIEEAKEYLENAL